MKGTFGLFTYFSQLDRDGSGYLEKDEIEYLAEMFFGKGDNVAVTKYVDEVFDKFDYDHSGELSYEEARDFIKDVYQFIDKCGGVSDEQREKFLEVISCEDSPADIQAQYRTRKSPDKNQPTKNALHGAYNEHKLHDETHDEMHDVKSAPNMHEIKSLEMNVHESVPHEDRIESDQPSFDQNDPGRLGEFELDSEYNKLAWILQPMSI